MPFSTFSFGLPAAERIRSARNNLTCFARWTRLTTSMVKSKQEIRICNLSKLGHFMAHDVLIRSLHSRDSDIAFVDCTFCLILTVVALVS